MAVSSNSSKHLGFLVVLGLTFSGLAIAAASMSNNQSGQVADNLFRQSVSIHRGKNSVAEVKLVKQNPSQINGLGNGENLNQVGAVAQTTFIFQSVESN